tara:strand:+ start:7809 stop:7949 length:141 start_codon:yes stop_codon:yes gene_type:complete
METKDLLDYIDFTTICEDYNLKSGDLTWKQTSELQEIIKQYINQNK